MLASQHFTLGAGTTTHFGAGAAGELPVFVAALNSNRVLLVSDPGVAAAGLVDSIAASLSSAGIDVTVFTGVRSNPGVEDLNAGAETARAFGKGVVVAVGGGAVLDVGKVLALMAVNDGDATQFDYRVEPARPGLAVIAVPTTAGTGSETNSWGVIDDPAAGRKFYAGHLSVVPKIAVLDPALTVGVPPAQTAASGMDALVHALESLSSVNSNPFAEGVALQVVRMVHRYLPRAVADGADLEARAQMLLAAHMAGIAFGATGLGLVHAAGHALSARLGAAHGAALSVLLPHVLLYNLPDRSAVYARVATAIDVADSHRGDEENARAAIAALEAFAAGIAMPHSLRELRCTDDLIAVLAQDALDDIVLANTPRTPTHEELVVLLQGAM